MSPEVMPLEPAPEEVKFTLPNGKKVVMTKAKTKHRLAALKETDEAETVQLIMISKISTFDGKAMNWMDLAEFDLADYFELNTQFMKLHPLKKEADGAAKD